MKMGKMKLTREAEAQLHDEERAIRQGAKMWKKRFGHIPSEPKDAARYLARRTRRFAGEYCEARNAAGAEALSAVNRRRRISSRDTDCLLSAGFHFFDAVKRDLPYGSAAALFWFVSILMRRGCGIREMSRAVKGMLDMQASICVRKALGPDRGMRRRIARAMKAAGKKDKGAGTPA
jgi:hypothetical protein